MSGEKTIKIKLKGRKAIVTGSSAGIGRAIAEGLARAGASVVINGRGEQRVAAALDEIRAVVPDAELTGIAADLSTAEGSAALVAQVADADILRAARHYLPAMVRRGWGRVVFISSESAIMIPKEMIDYGMTKTAQLAVSRGLAELVSGTGVTVNAVLPGPTRSEILGNWMKATAQERGITQEEAEQNFLKTMRPTTLLNRFTTTEEIANMVVYVCSEQASGTSDAALRVDGGVIRAIP